MIEQKKLAKAITCALGGTVLTLAGLTEAAAAEVYYNRYGEGSPVGAFFTDGWVYGNAPWKTGCFANNSCIDGTNIRNSANVTRFTGLSGGELPFGYSGRAIVNWALQMNVNDSVTLSSADAAARSGIAGIDMDIGRGAWQDTGFGNPNAAIGWAHNTDIGLFRLESNATVFFTPALTTQGADPNARFGITLFKGFDTGTGYGHHLSWNRLTDAPGSYTQNNPFNTTGLTYFAHNNDIRSTNPWEIDLPAGDYSVLIGGVGGLHWSFQFEGYQLGVTAVPVPAAVWLFGSALAGLIGLQRRKRQAV